jgi:hypothetical protein
VIAPLFAPTLPVISEIPVLPTAPTLEKRAKLAALPRLGVCAKLARGEDNRETLTKIVRTKLFFMLFDLIRLFIRSVAEETGHYLH